MIIVKEHRKEATQTCSWLMFASSKTPTVFSQLNEQIAVDVPWTF